MAQTTSKRRFLPELATVTVALTLYLMASLLVRADFQRYLDRREQR